MKPRKPFYKARPPEPILAAPKGLAGQKHSLRSLRRCESPATSSEAANSSTKFIVRSIYSATLHLL